MPVNGWRITRRIINNSIVEDNDFTNKQVVLFGYDGRADGERMRDKMIRMSEKCVHVLETRIVHLEPLGKSEEKCIALGRNFL